jgi:hypothetical protein
MNENGTAARSLPAACHRANENEVVVLRPINAQWSEQELTFLGQLSAIGFPIDHVAKFFGRDLSEVTEQATALYRCAANRKHNSGASHGSVVLRLSPRHSIFPGLAHRLPPA